MRFCLSLFFILYSSKIKKIIHITLKAFILFLALMIIYTNIYTYSAQVILFSVNVFLIVGTTKISNE